MILKIKEKLKNQDSRTLFTNFSYLSVIEISNYILPFLAIPYIVRVVGVEKYGVITLAYALMIFFNTITDFGFKLLATKYISINRDDNNKISKYFWTVIFSKLILLFVSLIIFLALILTVDTFYQEKKVFIFSFGIVIGNALFPIWFFQGMEKMKYIAILNVVSRLIYTALVFILINNIDDYTYIPLFNSFSFILIAVISLFIIHQQFKIRFVLSTINDIKLLFIEGWHLFLANISNSLYTTANTILLGLLTNYTVVGVVSLATTVSGAIIKILTIYNTTTFPYIAKFSGNKEIMLRKAKILLKLYSLILLLASIFTYLLASPLIHLLFGSSNEESIVLLMILSLLILIQPLGGFFTPYLVLKNKTKTISLITFQIMIANFIIIIPLILLYKGLGFVIGLVIVQLLQVALNVSHNKEFISR